MQEINNGGNAVLMPVESVLELSKENLSRSEYNVRFNEWMERGASLYFKEHENQL